MLGRVGSAIVVVNQALDIAGKAWRVFAGVVNFAVDALTPAIQQALEQERVDRKLAVALANLDAQTTDTVASLRAYADELQNVTGFSNEAIQAVQATLVAIGGLSGSQLERATKAVVDFAAQTGKGLEEVGLLIARAAQGATEQLGRMGIKLPETTDDALKFAAALEAIEGKVGGAGRAIGQTFGGAVDILRENFGDMQKALGATIIRVPELRDLLRSANDAILALTAAIQNSSGPIGQFVSDMVNATALLAQFGAGVALVGSVIAKLEIAKARDFLEALTLDTQAEAPLRGLRDLILSILPAAESGAQGMQALSEQLLASSTAARQSISEKRKLRVELASLETEAAASGVATSELAAKIQKLREELGLVEAPGSISGTFVDAGAAVDDLITKLKEASPLLKELLDLRLDPNLGPLAQQALDGFIAGAEEAGDKAALQLLAGLKNVAPGIAQAAQAALREVDARQLVDVLAKGGQEGALLILTAMRETQPELAQAAADALAMGITDGARKAKAALQTLGPAFAQLFDLRLDTTIGGQIQSVFGAFVEGAAAAGDQARLALLDAVSPVGSALQAQIEGALARVDADALLQTLVDAGDVAALKILESLEAVPQAIRDAATRALAEIQALDIKGLGESFTRLDFDPSGLLEMASILEGISTETLYQIELAGQQLLGQEQYNALLAEAFDGTRTLSEGWRYVVSELENAEDQLREIEFRQGAIADVTNLAAGAAANLGGALVAAATGAEKSFTQAARRILEQLAQMIVQALIFRAIMSSIGGFFGLGGQVSGSTAQALSSAPAGAPLAFRGGGQVPGILGRAQGGGQIIGTRTGRDSVLIAAQPGEVVVRNDVVRFVEEAILAQSARGTTVPGFSFNLFFNNVIRRDTVEELMLEITALVENKGGVLKASEVVT